ncbi:hypothetical protein [Metaplanococcus flavidus]|uniref:Uncharacterized protein n=1 Tax=Metaplanococcus flavidus TaxID=569883 RepID=A0ABW3LE80_9BACL
MENKILKRAVIKEELVKLTGNFSLAVTLNQLLYWSLKVKDKEKYIREEVDQNARTEKDKQYGWIYKTSEELSQEIMLGSQTSVRRYLKELVKYEFIFERRNPNPKYKYDKTYQYRVNLNKIRTDLKNIGYELSDFEHYYTEKEYANKAQEQNKNSINKNEHTSIHSAYTADQSEAAIPEITSNNTSKNISRDLIDEKDIKNKKDQADIDIAKKISKYYLEKSKKASLTVKEKEAVHQVAKLRLPNLKVIALIDECYREFAIKSPNESIRSFVYIANYISRNRNFDEMSIKIKKNQEEKINEKPEQSTNKNRKKSTGEEWLKLLDRKSRASDDHGIR